VDEIQVQRLRYVLSQAHEQEKPRSLFRSIFKKSENEPPVPMELGQLVIKPVKPRREKGAA
jgi:hypothetical protein